MVEHNEADTHVDTIEMVEIEINKKHLVKDTTYVEVHDVIVMLRRVKDKTPLVGWGISYSKTISQHYLTLLIPTVPESGKVLLPAFVQQVNHEVKKYIVPNQCKRVTMQERREYYFKVYGQALSYSILLLVDSGVPVTTDNVFKVLRAANVITDDPEWVTASYYSLLLSTIMSFSANNPERIADSIKDIISNMHS
jgi:hypothetical protein